MLHKVDTWRFRELIKRLIKKSPTNQHQWLVGSFYSFILLSYEKTFIFITFLVVIKRIYM